MAIFYTVVTLTGMAVFGKHQWLQHGEAFSVVFGFLAKFAPTEVRVRNPDLCRVCPGECLDQEGQCINCYQCFEKSPVPRVERQAFRHGAFEPGARDG